MTNVRKGHESTARGGVNLGPGLEVDLGPGLKVDLGPSLETSLGTILGAESEPAVKAAPALITNVCGPSLQSNPEIEG